MAGGGVPEAAGEPGSGGTGASNTAGRGGASSTAGRGGTSAQGGRATAGTGGTTAQAGSGANGCGKSPAFVGRKSRSASVGGVTRAYDLIVPASYDGSRPLAVVFEFHQSGGTIADAVNSGLHLVSGADSDAVFVYPQAVQYQSYGVGWDEACNGHDVELFDAALADVEQNFCVDDKRLFATGFSWGGDFANALACCRADVLRAVASASGAEWGAETGANASCGSAPMTAYRLTYGDMDTGYTQDAFESAIRLFTGAEGCSTQTDSVSPSPCVAYRGCTQPVVVCKYAGMGHQYPSGWADATWAFFAGFQ